MRVLGPIQTETSDSFTDSLLAFSVSYRRGLVWLRERILTHNPKVGGSNPPPATNPFNHLPAFATRIWHHLTPELCVSRRNDRRGGRACKQFSESSRDLAAVLGDHVCISHRRARIGVTEAILSSRHRNTLAVHHGLVPVAKSMEPATLDPELLEQGIEFPLPNEIRVPRRSVARGEEQTEPVRSPGAKVSAQMLRELRRNFAETIALFRLHRFDLPVPNFLLDFDCSSIEQ